MGTLQEEFATTNSKENTETIIQIKNGKLFVNGEETSNPELIGFAVLNIIELVIEGTTIDIQKF
ncbi:MULTISPECIES: hypothetical protein [Myroides]|uniref:hypothetical protein n=1 Tax=Myroides odoratus TaxID=256 RepID=UPI0024C0BEA6|nr:hypothetical protein [Myroides sp. mNGS23_01]WHT38389.1 hypothetical protein QNH98_15315 [Myroides sp. mNGS23_01]